MTTLLQTLESEKTKYDTIAFMTIDPNVREYAQWKAKEVQNTISLILAIRQETK
jgi:hypothetical protein